MMQTTGKKSKKFRELNSICEHLQPQLPERTFHHRFIPAYIKKNVGACYPLLIYVRGSSIAQLVRMSNTESPYADMYIRPCLMFPQKKTVEHEQGCNKHTQGTLLVALLSTSF